MPKSSGSIQIPFLSRRARVGVISIFNYVSETDGVITYTRVDNIPCKIDDLSAVRNTTRGKETADTWQGTIELRDEETPACVITANKDFIVVGTPANTITNKKAAIAAGLQCIAVNSVQEIIDATGAIVQLVIRGA
jgi:hypothetical protein